MIKRARDPTPRVEFLPKLAHLTSLLPGGMCPHLLHTPSWKLLPLFLQFSRTDCQSRTNRRIRFEIRRFVRFNYTSRFFIARTNAISFLTSKERTFSIRRFFLSRSMSRVISRAARLVLVLRRSRSVVIQTWRIGRLDFQVDFHARTGSGRLWSSSRRREGRGGSRGEVSRVEKNKDLGSVFEEENPFHRPPINTCRECSARDFEFSFERERNPGKEVH